MVAFSRFGYDGVGVREIAQEAGVTAMLVNRYFGSKEELFAEAVTVALSKSRLLTDDIATLSRHAAEGLLREHALSAEAVDPFLLMLRSAANPRAAKIMRDGIERHHQARLESLLSGPDASMRAAMILSVIAGFQLMNRVIGVSAITEGDPVALAGRLEAIFEMLACPPDGVGPRKPGADAADGREGAVR